MSILSIIFTYVNAYPCGKFFNYGFKEQMKDIMPNIVNSIIMYVYVTLINLININIFLKLTIQCLTGVLIYLGLSIATKNEQLTHIVKIIKDKIQ